MIDLVHIVYARAHIHARLGYTPLLSGDSLFRVLESVPSRPYAVLRLGRFIIRTYKKYKYVDRLREDKTRTVGDSKAPAGNGGTQSYAT